MKHTRSIHTDFKESSGTHKLPDRDQAYIPKIRESKLPLAGRNSFHFGKEQGMLSASQNFVCCTQPLLFQRGIFLSEVGKIGTLLPVDTKRFK